VKGVQHADLAWSGIATVTTNVDILRGDVPVATNLQNSGAYTDNIGAKGGATYTYLVCEAPARRSAPHRSPSPSSSHDQ
jgi:hypothetical protein